jgi:hypothetical protein
MSSPGHRAGWRLDRRAEAATYYLEDLLDKVKSGEVRIPAFQRALKWNDQDRTTLFDSIYRGFPIGTLLLWRRPAPAATVRFGALAIDANERDDALWIVDGQQRVTTLAESLLLTTIPGQRVIVFDLETEAFRYRRLAPMDDQLDLLAGEAERLVPVSLLADSHQLIDWISRNKSLPRDLVDRALDCGKRLREYRIPAYVVDTDDEELLRTIFDRTNRAGRRLDETDVFTALFGSFRLEDDLDDLSRVSHRLAARGFGSIDRAAILTALKAVAGLPLDRDFTKDLERTQATEALARAEAALARAVQFLREQAGIVHAKLLPYELPLIVLARFFDCFPEPRQRSLTLLRRWLWRGSLSGVLSGATVALRQHVEAVRANDEDESVQRLLQLARPREDGAEVEFHPFSLAKARSKLEMCALADLHPRHALTGEQLSIAALFTVEDGALPKVFDQAEATPLARTSVNRLLHPPMSPRTLVRALAVAPAEVLASHAIPEDARTALLSERSEDFLSSRSAMMRHVLHDYFRRQAEFGADDSPSLEWMLQECD